VRPLPPEEALKWPQGPLRQSELQGIARFPAPIWHFQSRALAVTNAISEETVFFEVPLKCLAPNIVLKYFGRLLADQVSLRSAFQRPAHADRHQPREIRR
jgi:hypothetical protein